MSCPILNHPLLVRCVSLQMPSIMVVFYSFAIFSRTVSIKDSSFHGNVFQCSESLLGKLWGEWQLHARTRSQKQPYSIVWLLGASICGTRLFPCENLIYHLHNSLALPISNSSYGIRSKELSAKEGISFKKGLIHYLILQQDYWPKKCLIQLSFSLWNPTDLIFQWFLPISSVRWCPPPKRACEGSHSGLNVEEGAYSSGVFIELSRRISKSMDHSAKLSWRSSRKICIDLLLLSTSSCQPPYSCDIMTYFHFSLF